MSQFKPKLSFWQIINRNVGFFGLPYSFGLQQANMSPNSFPGNNPVNDIILAGVLLIEGSAFTLFIKLNPNQ